MSASEPQQRVGWFELFYDLVLVAAVAQSSRVFASEPTWGTTVWIGAALFTLFSIWALTTFSRSLDNSDRITTWLIVVVQMLAVIVAALSMGRDNGIPDHPGFLALAVAFATISGLYVRLGRKDPSLHRITGLVAWSTGAGALVFLIAGLVPEQLAAPGAGPISFVFIIGLAIATVPFYTVAVSRAAATIRINREHLNERFGLLVIIVLGEGFVSLIIKLGSVDAIANPFFFVLTMLVVFSIWVIYFHSVAPYGMPLTPGRLRIWLFGHWLLLWGAIASATAFAMLTLVAFDSGKVTDARYWSALPLLAVMVSLLILSLLTPTRTPGVIAVHVTAIGALIVLTALAITVLGSNSFFSLAIGGGVFVADAIAFTLLSRRAGTLKSHLG